MASRKSVDKKRGRPATGQGVPVGVRMDANLIGRLDAWREAQPDQPGRPEAVRRLVAKALGTAD
jgi:hypothetical protein